MGMNRAKKRVDIFQAVLNPTRRRVLITGITGQDGSFMADRLLAQGFRVFGLVRHSTRKSLLGCAEHLRDNPNLIVLYGDITDPVAVREAVQRSSPEQIYHFAAQSHVGESFREPDLTMRVNVLGTLNLLQAAADQKKPIRVLNACSSEMFGRVAHKEICNEQTPFQARSPYAASKIAQFYLGESFREATQLRIWNAISFNHESERRGETFVTRKITRGMVRVSRGLEKNLRLGNLDACRDWGYAPEFCEAFQKMLNLPGKGEAFVVATGSTASVEEFLSAVVDLLATESLPAAKLFRKVKRDPKLMRPADVPYLQGDSSALQKATGWIPVVAWRQLARIMVEADLQGEGLEKGDQG